MSSKGTLIPYQGVLQGNGAAPATWVILSTPLLNMMQTAGHGTYLKSPISQHLSYYMGYAYVDDTDLVEYQANDPTIIIDEVMNKMQRVIDRWEGGLTSTGGALVLEKCWVYPISFQFDKEGDWSYETTAEVDVQITMKDQNDNRQNMQQEEVYTAKKTLGVFLAPDGNNDTAVKEL